MRKGIVIAGFVIVLVVGVSIGLMFNRNGPDETDGQPATATAVSPENTGDNGGDPVPQQIVEGDSDTIPISGSPMRGAAGAAVTIVVFTEFQCGFCAGAAKTIRSLESRYGDDLRIVFKHRPLRIHKNAVLAGRAAMAARNQGKFWEYHDALFANWTSLTRSDLEVRAQKLELDLGRFRSDLDSDSLDDRLKADTELAEKLDAAGAPTFFINGIKIAGNKPAEVFTDAIDAELPKARGKTYADRVAANFESPIQAKPTTQPAGRGRPPGNGDTVVYKVPVGAAHTKGPKDAIVTIVEFSEFQCPYCSKVHPTVKKLLADPKYKDKVRIAFKHHPLSFHERAAPASKAALAAGEQGKFWAYHDRIFESTGGLEDADLLRHAKAIGLDLEKFKKDSSSKRFDKIIKDDTALALRLGATGTPHFFVNGVRIKGAKPLPYFQQVVDEAIERTGPLVDKGLRGDALYAEIMKDASETYRAAPANPTPQAGPPPAPTGPVSIEIRKGVPVDGPASAEVTIVEFSDFQCPYCSKTIPVMQELKKKYGGKIRVAFMHMPLDFHKEAKLAAEASMAAHEQGKFWEYHDLLFQNQTALQPEDLHQYAEQLGLQMGKFKKALKSNKFARHIELDLDAAKRAGASGTPTFYVNGRQVVGAQPAEEFSKLIDEELAGAK